MTADLDETIRDVREKARQVPPCFNFRKGLIVEVPHNRAERRAYFLKMAALFVAKLNELDLGAPTNDR